MSTPVHGTPSEMMASLFGGALKTTTAAATGREKRLELDLRPKSSAAVMTAATLESVAERAGLSGAAACEVHEYGMACLAPAGIAVWAPNRVIITTDMDVQLHEAVTAVVALLGGAGYEVEWASFVRKNTACPWDARDHTMAIEYAALKESFPAGRPFVFGAVDSDHYFYFVYDALQRGPGCVESDVQINIKMYDVAVTDEANSIGMHTVAVPGKPGAAQAVKFGAEHYESLRAKKFAHGGNMVSFESNAEAVSAMPALSRQLIALRPKRFTVMMLLDPQSESGRLRAARRSVGLDADSFPGYKIFNRTANTFEHGYAVNKVTYVAA